MKSIGYLIFAMVYYICHLFPVKAKKVMCIMTHDDGEGSNVSIVAKALKEAKRGFTLTYITKSETMAVKSLTGLKKVISFFLFKPYELATSEYILLDNVFLPLAYVNRRKKVKIIQLWHGTGTIKKFGQDVNTGKLKSLEQRANKNITHLIVNSPAVKKLYAGAFGIEEDKVYPIGMPKTDELLQRIQRAEQLQKNKDKEQIYQKYNIPADKKLVLYAPTFRDQEVKNPKVAKQLEEIERELSEEYYLGLRLHPHVAESFQNNTLNSRVCQLSYETDLNSLLMASDVLITDYSSILFDYSLTERPMVFYAYDLEEFSENGRGFYEDYIRYIPGPVAHTGEEVAEILNEHRLDSNQVKAFKETYFYYLDGKATKRLIDLM